MPAVPPIEIPSPMRVRVPTGNDGANNFWPAGGQTIGGIPEAIVDPVPPGAYVTGQSFSHEYGKAIRIQ
jgi:hypothetical protein